MDVRKEVFFCYDLDLADYLRTNKQPYYTIASNPKTQRIFTLFKRTDLLTSYINTYKSLTNSKL